MRIKYTRYETIETSSLFLFTCTFILFIEHKLSLKYGFSLQVDKILVFSNISPMPHKLFESYDSFFSQPMQKTKESNEYPYHCLINKS